MIAEPSHGARRFWRQLSLTHKGLAVLSLPISILAVGFSFFSVRAIEEQTMRHDLGQTLRFRASLDTVTRDLLTVESTARALFVSSSSSLYPPYLQARKQAKDDLEKLDVHAAKNPARLQDLHNFALEKLSSAEALAAAAGTAGEASSPGLLLLEHSAATMKKVKETARKIDAAEEQVQRADLAGLEHAHDRTLAAGSAALGLGLLPTIGSTVIFTRSVSRRIQSLQVAARAIKSEAPLAAEDRSLDEIGQLGSELERTSESLAGRVRELRASQEQMRAIVDHTTAIVYIKDLESRYLLVNPAYEAAFGIKPREVIGRSSFELYGEKRGAELEKNDRLVIEKGVAMQFEESVMSRGRLFTYLSVKAPVFDSRGEVYGICGISTNVTERPWNEGPEPDGATKSAYAPAGARKASFLDA